MRKESNFLYYSFIISIFLHIIFFTIGIILSKEKKNLQFQKITFVEIEDNLNNENKISKKYIEKTFEKKESPQIKKEDVVVQTKEKIFSPYEVENPDKKASGGGAEVITSLHTDSSGFPVDSFIIQDVSKGKGEGIGLSGEGKGIGVGGDKDGDGVVEENYIPPKTEEKLSDVDKSKFLKEYIAEVVEKIEKNKKYPEEAKNENIEGKIELKITISKKGTLEDVKILSSSGYKILDNASVLTVKNSAPFPSIPDKLEKEKLYIKLKIVFKLEKIM